MSTKKTISRAQRKARAAKRKQQQIAEAIGFVSIHTVGGSCMYYNLMAKAILDELGITTRLVHGGMVYRVGPDQLDGVFFCGADNQAAGMMQHYWLETPDGQIIDFSSKEWKESAAMDVTATGLPPINWQVDPPPYIWTKRANVVDPNPGYLPRIGKAFYNADASYDRLEDAPGGDEVARDISILLPGVRSRLQAAA